MSKIDAVYLQELEKRFKEPFPILTIARAVATDVPCSLKPNASAPGLIVNTATLHGTDNIAAGYFGYDDLADEGADALAGWVAVHNAGVGSLTVTPPADAPAGTYVLFSHTGTFLAVTFVRLS